MIARDLEEYLPNDILTKIDRASMEYGLEARTPFLDHELAEWALSIPIRFKRLDGKGKWPLRKLLSQKLPKNLYERPKMGFGLPLRDLISGPFKAIVYEYLSEDKIIQQKIFNPNFIKEIIYSNYELGKRFHNQIWVLLMFQLWYFENF
jgi:asparagine synthase (glutamine-hydrolysing)